MVLDGRCIFDGEIRKAPGTLESPDECSEVVLFTKETEILTKIADADAMCGYFTSNAEADIEAAAQRWIENVNHKKQTERPRTADINTTTAGAANRDGDRGGIDLMQSYHSGRPMTAAVGSMNSTELLASLRAELTKPEELPQKFVDTTAPRVRSEVAPSADTISSRRNEPVVVSVPSATNNKANNNGAASSLSPAVTDLVRCRVITLIIESTWGDLSYTGLAGLEVLLGTQASPA